MMDLCIHCHKRKINSKSSQGLCYRCFDNLNIRKQYPTKMDKFRAGRILCSRCRINVKCSRTKELCRTCLEREGVQKEIRTSPPASFVDKSKRTPGDPPYHCFWCKKWRCLERMRLCDECQEWYNQRSDELEKEENATEPDSE